MIRDAFNFNRWLEEHRHELVPPVGNKNLYHESDDYIVMVVAGPNARKDYHYNETEEWFFQLEGHITVRIQEDGKPREVRLGPGDMFCARPKHRTARFAKPEVLDWFWSASARGVDLPTASCGFANRATIRCIRPTLNCTTSKRTFCRISANSTAPKRFERAPSADTSWSPTLGLCSLLV